MSSGDVASRRLRLICFAAAVILLCVSGLPVGLKSAAAQDTSAYFNDNCLMCHTIGGGPGVGPDLKDVSKRKDKEWLIQFLLDPEGMIEKGDPYALKLQNESGGMVMPSVPGMDRALAEAILRLIEEESRSGEPPTAGRVTGVKPATPQDIATGRELFLGIRQLTNGGPACLGCHHMNGLGGFGGGRLGADLTGLVERMRGRSNVAAWLQSPPTATMQPLFKKHALTPEEITALAAFLEDAAQAAGRSSARVRLYLALLSVGGSAIGLVTVGVAWRNRFRSARQALVQSAGRASKTRRKGGRS